jgi:predicted nucleotidyltransferase component of viral defense system
MPEVDDTARVVDIAAWSAKVRANRAAYESRQLTEIFLTALSLAPSFRDSFYLKGGILMALAYASPRSTSDVDLTADSDPVETADALREELDHALQRATAALGFSDLVCRLQTAKPKPHADMFEDAQNPSLRLTVAAARRGSADATSLAEGKASRVLRVDITFKEPVGSFQILGIGSDERRIRAYSLTDLIAEKLRALLQQSVRDRYRRQDVYDIVLLLQQFDFDAHEREVILSTLREKAQARSLPVGRTGMANPEIAARARADWPTLAKELDQPLPDFDECFDKVLRFYESLPW